MYQVKIRHKQIKRTLHLSNKQKKRKIWLCMVAHAYDPSYLVDRAGIRGSKLETSEGREMA
jgi:hypothetical protein